MDDLWKASISRRYASLLDELEASIRSCPDDLWETSVWPVTRDQPYVWPIRRTGEKYPDEATQEQLLPVISAFWNVAYHTLFHIDFYLSGGELPFKAPKPFKEADHRPNTVPARTLTRDELLSYSTHNRAKARQVLDSLTPGEGSRMLKRAGQPFAELILHNLIHAYEHAAQLELFLGQRGVRRRGGGRGQALLDRVRQRSDAEIDGFVESFGGYARLLPMVVEGVARGAGPAFTGTIAFNVGASYGITASQKGLKVSKTTPRSPGATITASPQDFLRIATGDLDLDAALASGRLRVEGDASIAAALFRR